MMPSQEDSLQCPITVGSVGDERVFSRQVTQDIAPKGYHISFDVDVKVVLFHSLPWGRFPFSQPGGMGVFMGDRYS